MRQILSAAAVVAAALLVACGGGSANPPPINTGTAATPSPAPAPVYALAWTGTTHSKSGSSTLRRVLDTNSVEPIELAATNGRTSLIASSGATDGTLQVTATVAGTPVPVPQPSPGAVSIANNSLAVASPLPAPSSSPSAGPLNVADVQSGTTTGSTTVTVTMPDGSKPSGAVNVYLAFTIACPAGSFSDAVQAYKVAAHALVVASGAADGDAYVTAPRCTDTSTATNVAHFPYGYETFPAATPFSAISTALPFTSAGTSVDLATLASEGAQVTNPIGGVIFATASGDYVKVRFSEVGGTPGNSAIFAGAAEVGPGGLFPL